MGSARSLHGLRAQVRIVTAPRLRPARIAVTACSLLVGLCAAAAATDHPRVAFVLAILAAAAALSALRELVHRES